MKFVLAFSICSIVTNFCSNPVNVPTKFDTWSECVGSGGMLIQDFSEKSADKINKDRLYITYFCLEEKQKGQPT